MKDLTNRTRMLEKKFFQVPYTIEKALRISGIWLLIGLVGSL